MLEIMFNSSTNSRIFICIDCADF